VSLLALNVTARTAAAAEVLETAYAGQVRASEPPGARVAREGLTQRAPVSAVPGLGTGETEFETAAAATGVQSSWKVTLPSSVTSERRYAEAVASVMLRQTASSAAPTLPSPSTSPARRAKKVPAYPETSAQALSPPKYFPGPVVKS